MQKTFLMSLLNFKIRWNQPMTRINFANICIIRKNFVPSWENMKEGETKTLVELRSVSVYHQSELNWCRRRDGVTNLPSSISRLEMQLKVCNKNMIGFSNQLVSPSVKIFFKTFFPLYLAGLKLTYSYDDLWPLYLLILQTFEQCLSHNFYRNFPATFICFQWMFWPVFTVQFNLFTS